MSKTYLIQLYCITLLIFSTTIICSKVSICDQTPFVELCNLIIGPEFESRDSSIMVSASKTREALKHLLATSRFDGQAKTSLMDCLELYDVVINHLNVPTSHMSAIDVKRWLSATIINHHMCLNGFIYFNFSKLLEDTQVKQKLVASKLFTNHDGLVRLTEVGTRQPNLVVAQDGSGDFSTITEAIKEAEKQRGTGISTYENRFIIHVKAGTYNENVIIKQSLTNIMLIGDGIDATVITNDQSVHDKVSTTNTATVQVWGQGFVAARITFENTAGPEKEQAIALFSDSDLSAFYQCSFKGYQDTLCLAENKQFLHECDIYGTIDFIFGDATAVLQNCNIYVRTPLLGQENTITAQGRDSPTSPTGFVIINSRVKRAPDSNPTDGVKTYLGRPWRDYSRVVYLKCDFGDVIDPAGWLPFADNTIFDKLYYAEYMNTGESADTSGRIKWPGYHVLMTEEEAQQFSVGTFLSGDPWIPGIGLPFVS